MIGLVHDIHFLHFMLDRQVPQVAIFLASLTQASPPKGIQASNKFNKKLKT